VLALTDVGDAGDPQATHRPGHGLALRVEDLGLGQDIDDHAGHAPQVTGRLRGYRGGVELVHLGHSCVVADTGSARILLDPGAFSSGYETLEGLDAILVTHQHVDHLDLDKLPALLGQNPDAELVVDTGTAEQLRERDIAHTVREPGETFTVGGAAVEVVGGDHAVIHPDIPQIANNGYLLDGTVLHPGDAFTVPERTPDVLLLPTAAPWLKASEAVDYLRAVAPPLAVPIHEAVLANPDLHYQLFSNLGPEGTDVRIAPRGVAFAV
jgi:L-ascorbate metabolism protein UlaG (beta-lactamase superfamily)